jgi:hypothetical protein
MLQEEVNAAEKRSSVIYYKYIEYIIYYLYAGAAAGGGQSGREEGARSRGLVFIYLFFHPFFCRCSCRRRSTGQRRRCEIARPPWRWRRLALIEP